jgi:hypothetical protein
VLMDLRVRSQVTKGNNSSVLELSTRKQSAADVCGGAIGKEGFERELNYSLHFSPPQLNQGVSRQPSCMRAAFLRSRRAPSSFLCASVCVCWPLFLLLFHLAQEKLRLTNFTWRD